MNSNVRTSILPFGYNKRTNSYRFSLCIDLNPNSIAANNSELLKNLQHFFRNYATTVFPLLCGASKERIFLEFKDRELALSEENLCFPKGIINQVPSCWKDFLAKCDDKKNQSTYTVADSGLDIGVDKVTTYFESKDKVLPDPQQVREKVVAAFQQFAGAPGFNAQDSAKKAEKFNGLLEAAIEQFDGEIKNITSKFQGISDFAERQNQLEFKNFQLAMLTDMPRSIFGAVECMLEAWSFLDSNNVLQRIMGKTIDFEVHEKAFHGIADKEVFNLRLGTGKIPLEQDTSVVWEHLTTPVRLYKKEQLMIVVESSEITDEILLESKNYDVSGKLIGLNAIKNQVKDYLRILNDPSKKESEKFAIRRRLIALDTAALTIGINTYNRALSSILESEAKLERKLLAAYAANEKNAPPNFLYRIRKGYRFAVKSNFSDDLTPIGQRKNILKLNGKMLQLPEELAMEELAISTGTGTHAIVPEVSNNGNKLVNKVIQDEAMLNWFGENTSLPSIFSVQEDETNFEPTMSEGSTGDSTRIVSEAVSNFYQEDYVLKGVTYEKIGTQNGLNITPEGKPILITYSIEGVKNKKLIYGRSYQLVITPQYKNGWGIPYDKLPSLDKEDARHYYSTVENFVFKRNEPVKPVEFYLLEPLVDVDGMPVNDRDGELVDHLVIRNYANKDDDEVYKTVQKSVRYILPPAISFQQAFWYHKIFDMSPVESYKWYLKYHFPKVLDGQKRDEKFNLNSLERYSLDDLEEVLEGSTEMRAYYLDRWFIPNHWERDKIINYLPDPLSKGFRLEFFLDKLKTIKAPEYEQYEQLEFYFSGKYPKISAWKIIICDYRGEDNYVEMDDEEITIRVEKGKELYLSARTILDEVYESQFETFGNYNDYTKFGNNDLLTPAMDFSVVHATQRPLVRPKFNNLLHAHKTIDTTDLKLVLTTNLEQTASYFDKADILRLLDDTLPTGVVELYSKWEEYKDDPKHIVVDDWTPDKPINNVNLKVYSAKKGESIAVYESRVDLSKQIAGMENSFNKIGSDRNYFKNYATDLELSYDLHETKYLEKYYWIKNKSKFTGYYPKQWGTEEHGENKEYNKSKEYFNRLSATPFLVRVLNSKKPLSPVIADRNINIISVNEEWKDKKTFYRKSAMNRLRIYFERGRLSSGKGERIGFVLNEPQSVYNDEFVAKGLVSIVGRDIISDQVKPYDGLFRNEDVLLTKSNFITHDPHNLRDDISEEKVGDLESFDPKYISELGLMTYLPKFDKKLNLWYLDIEIDVNDSQGRELHSPFLRFSLVHYQEYSINYNGPGGADIKRDCRISEVLTSRFVYIFPTTNIKLSYDNGCVKVQLSVDSTSLKHSTSVTSKFYMVVRHALQNGIKWTVADREKRDDGLAFVQIVNASAELEFIKYSNTQYQVVIIETEDWGNDIDHSFDALIENRKSRIVHLNVFQLS